MISINQNQKIYIMASLEDNLEVADYYPEGKEEAFRKVLSALEYDEEKLDLSDEEKEISIESLQVYQFNRFNESDYEWKYIENILNHLNKK
ncbi:MAG: hypothetical protein IKP12_02665 [Acholeplasmatales bacterium]|nr:hypothetical protein [Acholeplasmatales bacterium]